MSHNGEGCAYARVVHDSSWLAAREMFGMLVVMALCGGYSSIARK